MVTESVGRGRARAWTCTLDSAIGVLHRVGSTATRSRLAATPGILLEVLVCWASVDAHLLGSLMLGGMVTWVRSQSAEVAYPVDPHAELRG